MLHHHVGDVDGQTGAWGFARGGMGAISKAMAAAARALRRRDPHRGRGGPDRLRRTAGSPASPWRPARRSPPRTVITTAHPKISFLDLVDRAELPPDFVADIRATRPAPAP